MEQAVIAPARGDSEVKSKPRRRRINWLPIWLILPTVLVLLAIQVYPVFYTIALSFQERKPSGWIYVGLRNFERLFGASAVRESIGHTVIFLVGYVALTLSLGFIIALLLNRKSRLSGTYITLLFIPWILADIIAGAVFRRSGSRTRRFASRPGNSCARCGEARARRHRRLRRRMRTGPPAAAHRHHRR